MSEEKKEETKAAEENKAPENADETAVEVKEEEEKPKPKEYTPEEIEEIAKRVETYSDQTPAYDPKHVLSPEYSGNSNYEEGIKLKREETEQLLAQLRSDTNANPQKLRQAEEDLKTLDYLYQNFHIGMNVFRTAKGGRDKLRE